MKSIKYALLALLLLTLPARAAAIRTMEVIYPNGSYALRPPDYVDTRVLAAGTAEAVTVPTGANTKKAAYVNFASTCDFYANYTTTAAVAAADVTDGTGSELNPTVRFLGGSVTTISIIAPSTCTVSLSWYM